MTMQSACQDDQAKFESRSVDPVSLTISQRAGSRGFQASSPLETIFPKVHSFVQTNGRGTGRHLQAGAIQCSNTTVTAACASAGDLVRSVGSVTGLN